MRLGFARQFAFCWHLLSNVHIRLVGVYRLSFCFGSGCQRCGSQVEQRRFSAIWHTQHTPDTSSTFRMGKLYLFALSGGNISRNLVLGNTSHSMSSQMNYSHAMQFEFFLSFWHLNWVRLKGKFINLSAVSATHPYCRPNSIILKIIYCFNSIHIAGATEEKERKKVGSAQSRTNAFIQLHSQLISMILNRSIVKC